MLEVDLGGNVVICIGGIMMFLVGEYIFYNWLIGVNGFFINVSIFGIYSVIVINDFGCEGSDVIEVSIGELF